ncbi:TPA: hypothetical protein NPN89_003749 [Klebsiella quasipneumoniae subsp. similipneumoniae]|nr:hypothetical protein [Klebsiella quasipneumoniae subsp. similipneumoniae]HCI6011225.1 hypothetical protein [Klebsiella quasipneumoniae subsp. similipneumoniae]
MSKYSCINIVKSKAKELARAKGIKHSDALELLAKEAKFSGYHELAKVAQHSPMESRLMAAALGCTDLKEVIYLDEPYSSFLEAVDDDMSGAIASTNAVDFTVEDLHVNEAQYDDNTGVLDVDLSFVYEGELLPDRAYTEREFSINAVVQLIIRDGQWSLVEDSFAIPDEDYGTDHVWDDEAEWR